MPEKSNQSPEESKPGQPEIVQLADIFDEMGARQERWAAESRIGTVSYDAEFKAVCFHFDAANEAERYHVYLSQLAAPENQMRWLNHLRHKNWFTREVFNDLLDVLEMLGVIKQGL